MLLLKLSLESKISIYILKNAHFFQRKYCGTEIDTWSCGVILFALLAGHLPFDEEVIPALFKKIREAEYQMPTYISPEAQDLIRRMLQPDISRRIQFSEIKKHPWLQQNNFLYLQINENIPKMFINRINEEILHQIVQMGFNFENFTEQKVREAILRKQDYSFVIAYSLMLDEYCRQQLEISTSNCFGEVEFLTLINRRKTIEESI